MPQLAAGGAAASSLRKRRPHGFSGYKPGKLRQKRLESLTKLSGFWCTYDRSHENLGTRDRKDCHCNQSIRSPTACRVEGLLARCGHWPVRSLSTWNLVNATERWKLSKCPSGNRSTSDFHPSIACRRRNLAAASRTPAARMPDCPISCDPMRACRVQDSGSLRRRRPKHIHCSPPHILGRKENAIAMPLIPARQATGELRIAGPQVLRQVPSIEIPPVPCAKAPSVPRTDIVQIERDQSTVDP
ncbi:hypothetical protein J2W33_006330 [Variovorax boronicumulans]|nr:hypothetical protein [Variovorax boronicumulans]